MPVWLSWIKICRTSVHFMHLKPVNSPHKGSVMLSYWLMIPLLLAQRATIRLVTGLPPCNARVVRSLDIFMPASSSYWIEVELPVIWYLGYSRDVTFCNINDIRSAYQTYTDSYYMNHAEEHLIMESHDECFSIAIPVCGETTEHWWSPLTGGQYSLSLMIG